jgi:ABC-type polysaccharide/polyol phosphate export permease
LAGMNMQKPMLGDPSGLTDTMWDMIVNAVGAFVISCVGWWYMRANRRSFIDILIHKFIARNAHLFRRKL